MVLLLVTGQLAKEIVLEQAKKCKIATKVIALNMPVASLMKPTYIALNLKNYDLSNVDCIMVPGLIQGDISIIEKTLGIRTVKGPKNAYEISYFVNNFGLEKLDKDKPACEIYKEYLKNNSLKIIEEVENNEELLKNEGNFKIRNLKYGIDFPVRIIAEIVDSPKLEIEHFKEIALNYLFEGADVIDIGMVANESNEEKVEGLIKTLREITDKPISLDSMDYGEINKAIESGVDMILSLDLSLLEKVRVKENVHYVLVPMDLSTNYFPKEVNERVELLEEMLVIAKRRGIKNIILDVILDPPFSPSLISSFISYWFIRNKFKTIPILIGTGNITELIDSDTPGINAIMMAIATELGASFVLSTEVSDRCKGVIRELSIASKMMFIAKHKRTYPKNLGIDLIFYKDKKILDEQKEKEEGKIVYAEEELGYNNDPKGWFKIYVDRKNEEIIVHHKPKYNSLESDIIIKGKDVTKLYRKIVNLGLVSMLDHAAYLGSELQKAYVALKTRKSYIQDLDLFGKD